MKFNIDDLNNDNYRGNTVNPLSPTTRNGNNNNSNNSGNRTSIKLDDNSMFASLDDEYFDSPTHYLCTIPEQGLLSLSLQSILQLDNISKPTKEELIKVNQKLHFTNVFSAGMCSGVCVSVSICINYNHYYYHYYSYHHHYYRYIQYHTLPHHISNAMVCGRCRLRLPDKRCRSS